MKIPKEIFYDIERKMEKPKKITFDDIHSPEMTFIEDGEQIMLNGVKIFLHPLYPEFGCTYNCKVVDTESGKEVESIFIDGIKYVVLKLQNSVEYYIMSKFILESFYNSYCPIEKNRVEIMVHPEFERYGFNVNNCTVIDIESKEEVESIFIDGIKCVILKYNHLFVYRVILCFVNQCYSNEYDGFIVLQ